ncbi:MAG: T9SS type A sorting domain-containing protein [Balneolaceae bacterium]
MYKKSLLILFFTSISLSIFAQTPKLLDDDLSLRAVTESPHESVRLSFNKQDSTLYLLTQSGDILSVDIEGGTTTKIQSSSDHELEDVQGFDISGDGTFYLVGNSRNGANFTNTGIIKKGEVIDGNWNWIIVAESEPYPLSNTSFDHIMNGLVVSPDNRFLYINSGSRTDHGEVHSVDGLYPDLREADLTAKILAIPADSINLLLKNDLDFLRENGYVFAEGTRNSFSLAFDAEGNLFATENAGDRDDPEELNWLREGHHFGFPWNIGGNQTPMQTEDYIPEEDILLSAELSSHDFFYNDPDYPAPPEGITFSDPILNYGPDGTNYRDSVSGEIFSASSQDTAISSFTSHRSPLGLVFDTTDTFGGNYTGDGFALSFTGSNDHNFFLKVMEDQGEDLMHLKLTKTEDSYEMTSTTIASDFLNPIDAEVIGNKIYVVEHKNSWLNSSSTTHIWEITFPEMGTAIEEPDTELVKDFNLNQNYPNPFNPTTQISYNLSNQGKVTLEIFDALGRKVQTLVDKHQNAGSYSAEFNAEQVPSGMYFYRLSMSGNDQASQVKKMILLR